MTMSRESEQRARALVAAGVFGGGGWVEDGETSVVDVELMIREITAVIDDVRVDILTMHVLPNVCGECGPRIAKIISHRPPAAQLGGDGGVGG